MIQLPGEDNGRAQRKINAAGFDQHRWVG